MLRAGGTSTAMVSNGRRRVHTTFPDESELVRLFEEIAVRDAAPLSPSRAMLAPVQVEEYDINTAELLVRKRRGKSALGRQQEWEFLVGEPPRLFNPQSATLAPSLSNPSVARCDTARDFVWRVRNVPWPAETYEVTVEPASREVVLRTTNRKFFKRLRLPELDVARPPLPLTPTALTWQHSGTTLAISYRKPPEVLAAEEAEKQQRIATGKPEADGDVECKQQ